MIADISEPVEATVPKESGSELLAKILSQRRIEWNGRGKYREPVAPRLANLASLPKGWVWASLDQLFLNITDGDHQPPPQTAHGVPFLVIGNVRSGKIEFAGSRFVSREYAVAVDPFRKPTKGDILYSLVGSYGMAIKVVGDEEFCIQRHLAILRPHSLSPVSFLALILNSLGVFQQATSVATGTAQKTVPLAGLRKFAVPLPPLDEQQRLVAEIEKQLTRLEAGVAALRQVQTKVKRYRVTVLKAACEGRLVSTEADRACKEARTYEPASEFLNRLLIERRTKWQGPGKYKEPASATGPFSLPEGWTWASLEEGSYNSSYGTSSKCSYDASGPPILRIPNVAAGRLDLSDLKFAPATERIAEGAELVPGDLLIIRTNGSKNLIGRASTVRSELPTKTSYASYLIRFRLSGGTTLSAWIGMIWDASYLRAWIEQRAATSAGQHNISMSVLSTVPIPLPPLVEQARIIAEVERRLSVVDGIEAVIAANLRRAARLRQSILQKAFSGNII